MNGIERSGWVRVRSRFPRLHSSYNRLVCSYGAVRMYDDFQRVHLQRVLRPVRLAAPSQSRAGDCAPGCRVWNERFSRNRLRALRARYTIRAAARRRVFAARRERVRRISAEVNVLMAGIRDTAACAICGWRYKLADCSVDGRGRVVCMYCEYPI